MTEKLSGFVIDTPQHRAEDARQDEINKLNDERQELIAQGVAEDDKRILSLNRRLTELTAPGAAAKFQEVENLINSPREVTGVTDPSSTDNTDKLVDQALREVDSPETEQKKPSPEVLEFIKEKQEEIGTIYKNIKRLIIALPDSPNRKELAIEISRVNLTYEALRAEFNSDSDRRDLNIVKQKYEQRLDDVKNRLSAVESELIKIK